MYWVKINKNQYIVILFIFNLQIVIAAYNLFLVLSNKFVNGSKKKLYHIISAFVNSYFKKDYLQ
jgi:hypothetical protein